MNAITKIKTLALGLTLFSGVAFAQNITGKNVSVSVDGTSPMHNWTMTSNAATFTGTVSGNTINNVKFTMPAKNLKGTKGKMMDNKAHEALKADKSPNITFTATSAAVGKSNIAGALTIAGVTKNVSIPATVTKNGNSYTISGAINTKMSDFGMKTPGFMGVKTGDGVTVKVNIVAN